MQIAAKHVRLAVLGLVAAFAAGGALAQTLYKLIDKNGKVTYSEKAPPKDFEGKVEPISIDPNANRMAAPPAVKREPTAAEKVIRARPEKSRIDLIDAARRKVDAAKQAYEQARNNPAPDDVEWIARGATPGRSLGDAPEAPSLPSKPVPPANPSLPPPPPTAGPVWGGSRITGARPVPTAAYEARLAALERAWREAELELDKLESAR